MVSYKWIGAQRTKATCLRWHDLAVVFWVQYIV